MTVRNLVLVLGDQLNTDSCAFDGFDAHRDQVWMAEVAEESTHVWSSKQRTALFLSAMRHFAQALRSNGISVAYRSLTDEDNRGSLSAELALAIQVHRPAKLVLVMPGDYRVLQAIQETAHLLEVPLDVRQDKHFFATLEDFETHAKGRKQLRLEYWYRELRRKTGILVRDGEPEGGQWNFDADNRQSFGKTGPADLPRPKTFKPDALTLEVLGVVRTHFALHPGSLESFGWPVTREQALMALADFIEHRLPLFGKFEDAMWEGENYLYHSRLSAALNLKLLNPREVCDAAEQAYQSGKAPLAAVEGFIRQILGWREYVRGLYWHLMPGYESRNALNATGTLPQFFWTGNTDMRCLSDALRNTLDNGYAHHIQRLMVLGLYALMLGVEPRQVHEWYLSVYVDAVEWVELPNTVGMSQFADEGILASKPYVATGKYIDKMSNHCKGCRYRPGEATGPTACPYTTLYWDFMMRHEKLLQKNPRMALQVKNISRLSPEKRIEIVELANAHRRQVGATGTPGKS